MHCNLIAKILSLKAKPSWTLLVRDNIINYYSGQYYYNIAYEIIIVCNCNKTLQKATI